jgi:serine/threonine protein kinase
MVSKQDIVNAIKNLDAFLKVPELKGAKARLNKFNGNPFVFVGGFNMVFQLTHKSKKWAFRVWHVPIDIDKERYRSIASYLGTIKLPYFADTIYDEKGLIVSGESLDTVRMEWLEGLLLKDYIKSKLNDKAALEKLAKTFLQMCEDLMDNNISHGDLQEGNILVNPNGKINLIDYDSVCIPSIEGQSELVTGLKGYQHPSRFKSGKASLKADYFSELIIYLSILAIAESPDLWIKYKVEETQYLLFTEDDFIRIEKSNIYKDLSSLSVTIKNLLSILKEYLSTLAYTDLKPLSSYLWHPEILEFKIDKEKMLAGHEAVISWKTRRAATVKLDPRFKDVSNIGFKTVKPTETKIYKLTTENKIGKVERTVKIEVFPKPAIKFKSAEETIAYGSATKLTWEVEHALKVQLEINGNIEELSFSGEKDINPLEHTDYKLIVAGLDGATNVYETVTVKVYKRVEIISFVSDHDFVIERFPVKLSWQIENATELMLSSNLPGADVDVTGKTEIEVYPDKAVTYRIKAKNGFFDKTSAPVSVIVEKIPRIQPLGNIIPSAKDLIPSFDLNFKEISGKILSGSQFDFENAMRAGKPFSLKNSLKSLTKR